MMRYRLAVLLVLLGSATVSAQQDDLQALLDRMDTYLARYERALGEIVADESFRQRTIPGIPPDLRGTGVSLKPSPSVSRQLQSTVSFRRHRDRLIFQLDGRDTIRGVRTTRITFEENGRPTLIQGNGGRDVISRGVVWIDQTSGAVWRAQVFYRDCAVGQGAIAPEPRIDVEFADDRQLRMLVPQRMREIFLINSGRGEGEARYSNFRRFTTSARLVPQR